MTGINSNSDNSNYNIYIPLPSSPQDEGTDETQGNQNSKGAAQVDSVSGFEYSDQGQAIKGSITIRQTSGGNFLIVSLDPSNPKIPSGDPGNGGDNLPPNDWFGVNFAAAFASVMNAIVKMQMSIAYTEGETAIKQRQDAYNNSKSSADITRQTAELQADKKKLEAIQSFVSAGVAFMQMGAAMKNTTKAQHDADNSKAGKDYDAAKAELNRLRGLDPTGKPLVSASGAPPPPSDPAAIKAAEDKLSAAKITKEEVFSQKLQQHEQRTKYEYDILQNVTKGIFSTMEANIETQIGQLQAQKEMNEAYNRAIDQNLQNSTKYRDDAHSAISEFLRTFDNIMSKQMQWKSM